MIYNKKYQIFISSTLEDLVKQRLQVYFAILQIKQIPVGMEVFTSTSVDKWEFIKKCIDESDLFIVIIGDNYGSIHGGRISYTEKEFNYAQKTNKYIIGFIKQKNKKLSTQNKEGGSLLDKFKKKIDKTRNVKRWKTIDGLCKECTTSILSELQNNIPGGWIHASEFIKLTDSLNNERASHEMTKSKLKQLSTSNHENQPKDRRLSIVQTNAKKA